MRHADYRTTLRHYTTLSVADTAEAMNRLPRIARLEEAALAGTGTDGKRQQKRQHSPREKSARDVP